MQTILTEITSDNAKAELTKFMNDRMLPLRAFLPWGITATAIHNTMKGKTKPQRLLLLRLNKGIKAISEAGEK